VVAAETAFCAVLQGVCGRVLCVHSSGSFHSPALRGLVEITTSSAASPALSLQGRSGPVVWGLPLAPHRAQNARRGPRASPHGETSPPRWPDDPVGGSVLLPSLITWLRGRPDPTGPLRPESVHSFSSWRVADSRVAAAPRDGRRWSTPRPREAGTRPQRFPASTPIPVIRVAVTAAGASVRLADVALIAS
jgi:hypothetical protein